MTDQPTYPPRPNRAWVEYTHPGGSCADPEQLGYTTDQWVEEPLVLTGWLGVECGGCSTPLVPKDEPEQ